MKLREIKEIELKDVKASALDALVNFCYSAKDVIRTDEFYQLPGNQLVELISSEELQVPSEERVFEAVVKWVRFDVLARHQIFPQDYLLLQLSTHKQLNMQGLRAQPRKILCGETAYA
ncbi:BTB And Kelch, partial [Teladorsagia circumcincta]